MSKEYRQQKYNNKLKPNRHRGQRLARKKRWSKTEKRCKKRKMRNILSNHIHQKDWQVNHGVARYYFDKENNMYVSSAIGVPGCKTHCEWWEQVGCDCQGYHPDGVEICDGGAWCIREEPIGSISVSLQSWRVYSSSWKHVRTFE